MRTPRWTIVLALTLGSTFSPAAWVVGQSAAVPQPIPARSASHRHLIATNAIVDGEPLITRTVDLREVIERHAARTGMTLPAARTDVLGFLALDPVARESRNDATTASFELVDVDRFEVTAKRSYFDSLPNRIESLRAGKRQIVISSRWVLLTPEQIKQVNAMLIPESVQVVSTPLPGLVPVATAPSVERAPRNFVSTSTVVQQSTPVTTGRIANRRFESLLGEWDAADVESLAAPTVCCLPEQVCSVVNGSERPFVVGFENVGGSLPQPILQTVSEGIAMQLTASIVDDAIQLRSDISISEIVGVDTMVYAIEDQDQQLTLQIPKQKLKQVHLSTPLAEDTTLMVNPQFVQEKATGPGQAGKRMVLFLKAELVTADPVRMVKSGEKPPVR